MISELQGRRETVSHAQGQVFQLYINEEVENYPPHWHTDLEIIMPLENKYTAILEKQTYQLHPGDILIIPSGEMHELLAPETGRRMIFQIDHAIIREVNGFDSVYHKFYPCALIRKEYDIEEYDELVDLLSKIASEYHERAPLFEASIHSLILYFFVLLGRIQLQATEVSSTEKQHQKQQTYIDIFFNLCTFMNEHCTEDLTLEDLAKKTGFSKSHFIRLFKEFAGVSYYEYLTKRRMIHAEILLLDHPEYSISEIAMQSGFNSLATFNRVFKTFHNCTPTDYRKRFRTI